MCECMCRNFCAIFFLPLRNEEGEQAEVVAFLSRACNEKGFGEDFFLSLYYSERINIYMCVCVCVFGWLDILYSRFFVTS